MMIDIKNVIRKYLSICLLLVLEGVQQKAYKTQIK